VKALSTASAARALLDEPPDCAAICSKLCASLFCGLDILQEGIEEGWLVTLFHWLDLTVGIGNYTRFLILKKNRDDTVPMLFKADPCYRAIFRIYIDTNLGRVFEFFADMTITRIDRRPNPKAAPFHSIYFLEVEKGTMLSISTYTYESWAATVDSTAQSVKQAGYNADVIGIW
jgi:prephenate dehydratase